MAAVAYERWEDYQYSPGKFERRVWDIPNCTAAGDALATPGLPVVGSSSLLNRFMFVQTDGITVSNAGFRTMRVAMEFTKAHQGSVNTTDPNQSPLDEPPMVLWSPGISNEEVDIDADGNPLVNAAYDVIDPPPQNDFITLNLNIRRNESFYNLVKAGEFMDHVCDRQIVFFQPNGQKVVVPARCCLCKTIFPSQEYPADAPYVNVSYAFEIRLAKWGKVQASFDWRFANKGTRGFYELNGVKKIGDFYIGRDRVANPIMLDKTGKPLTPQFAAVTVTQANYPPVASDYLIAGTFEKAGKSNGFFIRYKKKPDVNFTGLGL